MLVCLCVFHFCDSDPLQTPPGSGIYNTTWLLPLPGYWDTHPASAGGTVPNRATHLHVYTGRNFTRMARRVRCRCCCCSCGLYA